MIILQTMAQRCLSSRHGNPRKQNDQRVDPYFGRPCTRGWLLHERGNSHHTLIPATTVPFSLPKSRSDLLIIILVSQADPHTVNWKQDFYGSNYQKLYSIKKKYDPNHIFYAPTAVGSDEWQVQGNGGLCWAGED